MSSLLRLNIVNYNYRSVLRTVPIGLDSQGFDSVNWGVAE